MNAKERRLAIKEELLKNKQPLSATLLAKQFHVSRQIIVGDIALLKAANEPIIATARGYLYDEKTKPQYVIACLHDESKTQEELETIVDYGATIEDVSISHPIYGELSGKLHISSRYEIQEFIKKCQDENARNLSMLSDGVHLHNLICNNDEQFERIKQALKEKGLLYEKD